ncbi:hypothetical protein ZIOFF_056751 [Zingiber officinale]|uniref:Uncharacterized protein n=1 Tax=Zingiber officinale TaxID=94328 RepID=A0A8J5FP23_ZINOF|nr:hypothetical protein ZIOFF_056751 [Zingiber officinale]
MADNASETSGISANPMSSSGQVQPVFTMTDTGGSGLQIVSEKLSETNYASWAVAVELYVEGHDKLDILHGTKVKPDEKDPSFPTWRRDNIQLMTWMLNSVNSGIKQVILHNKTTYDMWKTLEQMYGRRHDMLRTYQISSQIFKLEQGSMSVTNYFSTLKGLWDEFDYYRMENWSSTDDHQRYLKLLEKDRIIKFLDGLTAEFESLEGQILGLDPTPSLEQVYYKILSEEGRKRTMNNKGISAIGPPIGETSVFIGSANKFRPGGTKRQGDRFCRHCKRTNHDSDFCWEKYPEKKPEKFKHNAKKAPNSSNIVVQKIENEETFGENITPSFVPQVVPQVISSPIPLDVIENRKDAPSLGKDAPSLGAPSPDIITYKRRRHKQEPTIDRLVESDALAPDPVKQLSSSVESTTPLNMNELNLPVAVRKGVRSCTQHPISNYVSYSRLSPSYHAFVSQLSNLAIPSSYYEANFPPEDWLVTWSLPSNFVPNTIQKILDELTPENIRMFWESKNFEGCTDSVEPWYGTSYSVEKVTVSTIKQWIAKAPEVELHLPKQNVFIPSDLTIKNPQEKVKYPILLRTSSFSRLWYKPDTMFSMPKAYIKVEFNCPQSIVSPEAEVLTYIFTKLLIDYLNEYAYYAEVAGLYYAIYNTSSGFEVIVVGYNDKMQILLETIVGRIEQFEVKPDRFFVIKESITKEYENFKFQQPYQQAWHYSSLLLEYNTWPWNEKLEALPHLEPDHLSKFSNILLEKAFLEFYTAGNIEPREADSIVQHIEDVLFKSTHPKCKPLFPSQHLVNRIIKLEEGLRYYYPAEVLNIKDENSALIHYTQVSFFIPFIHQDEIKLNVRLQLFALIAKQAAFHQLRTVEQLGYITVLTQRNDSGTRGDPPYLEARVDAFLEMFESKFHEMTNEEYKNYVNALIDMKLEKFKNLWEESAFYWREIVDGTLKFDRVDSEVAALKELDKDELIDYFNKFIKIDSPQRKTLCVQVYGGPQTAEYKKDAIKVFTTTLPRIREALAKWLVALSGLVSKLSFGQKEPNLDEISSKMAGGNHEIRERVSILEALIGAVPEGDVANYNFMEKIAYVEASMEQIRGSSMEELMQIHKAYDALHFEIDEFPFLKP